LIRVVAEVVHAAGSAENHSLVTQELNKATANKLRVVAGTFRKVSTSRLSETISGVMTVNRESKPYTEQSVEGFKSVSSNMFMDQEKTMWRLEDTPGGKMLIKENLGERVEDMKELLSSLCSTSAWKLEASGRLPAEGGDFVAFTGLAGVLRYGCVAASVEGEDNLLIVPIEGEAVEISKDAVTEVVDGTQLPAAVSETPSEITASARGSVGVEQLVEYYKRLYGSHPEFFNQLVERIRSRAYA
jgi:hypothetical protein